MHDLLWKINKKRKFVLSFCAQNTQLLEDMFEAMKFTIKGNNPHLERKVVTKTLCSE